MDTEHVILKALEDLTKRLEDHKEYSEVFRQEYRDNTRAIHDELKSMNDNLHGKEGRIGLAGRVALLESGRDNLVKVLWIAFTAAIGSALASAWAHIKG